MLHGHRATIAEIGRTEVVDAAAVKGYARALGAHLVGIAGADVLNAFPPDPRYPQTPERISPYCKSVIVIVQRIPVGAFRCRLNVPVQYLDMLVLRRMDKIAYRLAEWLERRGYPSFIAAAQETDWAYKNARPFSRFHWKREVRFANSYRRPLRIWLAVGHENAR